MRCGILLNRKVLADLACWEPHSFKALTDIAQQRAKQDGLNVIQVENVNNKGVKTKAMRK